MRLIDADKLIDKAYDVSPAYGMTVIGVTEEDIEDAPTVEAIPITKKAFEMFEADYEARLKADMVAMLDKIRAEIEQEAFQDVNGSKFIFVNRVNQILDKCMSESEET